MLAEIDVGGGGIAVTIGDGGRKGDRACCNADTFAGVWACSICLVHGAEVAQSDSAGAVNRKGEHQKCGNAFMACDIAGDNATAYAQNNMVAGGRVNKTRRNGGIDRKGIGSARCRRAAQWAIRAKNGREGTAEIGRAGGRAIMDRAVNAVCCSRQMAFINENGRKFASG